MSATSRRQPADLIQIYECLCDETRLRILHLLSYRSLCGCHFQAILGAPQVKISKHLAYLRARKLVDTRREGAWIIYSLPSRPSRELAENLKCLQDCCREQAIIMADLRKMKKELASSAGPLADCCSAGSKAERRSTKKEAYSRVKAP
jgi:ArsR family transcriptional regulator